MLFIGSVDDHTASWHEGIIAHALIPSRADARVRNYINGETITQMESSSINILYKLRCLVQ